MKQRLINEFRLELRRYKAVPISPEFQEHVDVLNGFIPAFIDAIKDSDIADMILLARDHMMEQVIDSILDQTLKQPEEAPPATDSGIILTDRQPTHKETA